jgi:ferritin-like metal-binding protein YciE
MATAHATEQQSLRELMIEEIRDLYDCERQLVKALPKMAKGASSGDLRSLIEAHLGETQEQVKRLERAFDLLDEKPRGKHCAGIAGIIKEGSDLLEEDFDGAVLDAGIIAGAQRAEHYEMGAYGSVIAWAKQLGESELAALLEDTLEEEKGADEKLSALAESSINQRAASESEDRGSDSDDDEDDDDESPSMSSSRSKSSSSRGNGTAKSGSNGRSMAARSSSARSSRNGSAGRSASRRS